MKIFLAISSFILTISAPLYAQEFAYVTDSLQLRVYASANADSEVLQSIDSGDSVEVFATENGFSKVTTYDGTEGWVKSAFLVVDPPAKLLYYSVGEKNKELEAEIEALKGRLQTVDTTTSNEADTNKIEELQTALTSEQDKNQKLQEQMTVASNSQIINAANTPATQIETKLQSYFDDKKWLLIATPLAFVLAGFLLGIKTSSWRLKKRLHGFRI